ncbi:RNA helicase [Coprinopsis cinerea okayama7|uniref:RNA helicase n=1 Tax=Coprinopsis cinerea (strain Okayama-7 / 130 / ATCC MYA-4618 / FGSC 9003) TaxID=240176 RepID=A8P5Q3_COPC7|nr:RNA helicase [Coprinopsis cinerea okayama7\|eukprot:XP_001838999.2 RNA helicase [Coprinopsis cinerea okayama7\
MEAEADKHGLTVHGVIDLGCLELQKAERGVTREVVVRSKDREGEERAMLVHAYFVSWRAGRAYRSGFSVKAADFDAPISSSNPAIVEYTFQRFHIGRYEDTIELLFQLLRSSSSQPPGKFIIRRTITTTLLPSESSSLTLYKSLLPSSAYVPRNTRRGGLGQVEVVGGVPPPALKAIRYVVPLGEAEVPQLVRAILDDSLSTTLDDDTDSVVEDGEVPHDRPRGFKTTTQKLAQIRKFHPPTFDIQSYTKHFKSLLWYEEVKSDLAIPGLAEKRPSVLVGDKLLVQPASGNSKQWWEGYVYVVRQNEVGMKFHSSFPADRKGNGKTDTTYNVRFKLNRTVLRRQHQMLDCVASLWLAMHRVKLNAEAGSTRTVAKKKRATPLGPRLTFFNPKIASNERQDFGFALTDIHSLAYSPTTCEFVTCANSPGTGKTLTLVESILQILFLDPTAKVLVCAPSNSAADVLALRILAASGTSLSSSSAKLSRSAFDSRVRITPKDLFRLYAPSRSKRDVPDSLLPYTYSTAMREDRSHNQSRYNAYASRDTRHRSSTTSKSSNTHSTTVEETFTIPPRHTLLSYRVVVTTCLSSCILYGTGGVPRGHFTHVVVDEAGQGTEVESLVPFVVGAVGLVGGLEREREGTSGNKKSVGGDEGRDSEEVFPNWVLCGDPNQLGPIIRSGIARHFGFEKSLLERLMSAGGGGGGCYHWESGESENIVKLTKNFRSHEGILRYPNERFYGGELEACASHELAGFCLTSSILPRSGSHSQSNANSDAGSKFPVIFHSISGKDSREASSPSFFNVEEVLQVKEYVVRLKGDRNVRITDHDIGIISPYHAQCLKLRTALRPIAESVKIGSVEEFQGQERKVIIISTVRSSREFLEYDLHHTLGFVANPRRFNVAITRAQSLLVVVGDPNVLGLDPLWRGFLNYVERNGGWVGPEIPWDSSVEVPLPPLAAASGPSRTTSGEPNVEGPENLGTFRYDVAIRKAVEADMDDLQRRIERLAMEVVEDVDANVDRPWRDYE